MNKTSNCRTASPVERQFWLLDRQGKRSAYHVISSFSGDRNSCIKLFNTAQEVLNTFPIGRQKYHLKDSELKCTSSDSAFTELRYISESKKDLLDRFKRECSMPFDLEQGPVARLVLGTCENNDHALFAIVVHHIAIDLGSKKLIEKEIQKGLATNITNKADVTCNYKEFCAKLQQWIDSDKGSKASAFWREQVADIEDKALSFPAENPEIEPGYHIAQINPDLKSRLVTFCSEQKTDPFIVFLACYAFTLSRYFLSDTVSIAVPLSNRFGNTFEKTLGCFVNTLPIILNINDNSSALELINATRKKLLLAHRHQALPTVEIQSLAQQAGKSNLYSFGFTFEAPMQLSLNGAELKTEQIFAGESQLPVFLRCWEENGLISYRLEYDPSHLNLQIAMRFAESLNRILQQVTSSEGSLLTELDYLPKADEAAISKANSTDISYSPLLSLKAAFEQQVKKTPNQIALRCSNSEISYQQFNERSNRLANYLITQLNTGANDVIGVLCERSPEMMTAIYGIIKTGAAYLPLDPELPADRINSMLTQAKSKIVLTDGKYTETDSLVCSQVVTLEHLVKTLNDYSGEDPALDIPLDSPAYVIFTSGSTGRPKGVVNNHRGIANRLRWMQDQFSLHAGEVAMQKTPYSFDVSVWELFWPLQTGATLAIADHNSHKDPYKLYQQIQHFGVNIIHFVPTMLSAFLGANSSVQTSLRTVICSGEELTPELQGRFFGICPSLELANLYGPTEAAVDVTCWQCQPGANTNSVPIGYPIANTQIHIIDENMHPVPVGLMGELIISGSQVAQGYINNKQLTEQCFIANPFGPGMAYRTGDYARWNNNGTITYLGRKDFQVKINGVRIELADIDNNLLSVAGIENCVTIVGTIGKRSNCIISYYTSSNNNEISNDTILKHIRKALPPYMVPSFFQRLDTLPTTSSGKIDRKKLPQISIRSMNKESSKAGPSTELEQTIHDTWCTVLGRDDFDLYSSFFEAGGDSLLLMRVYEKLTPLISKNLSSVDLFTYPTIRSLADFLGNPKNSKPATSEHVSKRAQKMRSAFKR